MEQGDDSNNAVQRKRDSSSLEEDAPLDSMMK